LLDDFVKFPLQSSVEGSAGDEPFRLGPVELVLQEEEIAARLKCPIHGARFKQPIFHIYVPQWRRESELIRRQRLSEGYRKAWAASFGG
jgi:hypothetical protein